MIYQDEDFLQLSGLQHFKFCRRQWALIHVEKQWAENYRTTDGAIMHENAHDGSFTESRGDLVITRDMRVFSARSAYQARATCWNSAAARRAFRSKAARACGSPIPWSISAESRKRARKTRSSSVDRRCALKKCSAARSARRALLRRAAAAHGSRLHPCAAAGGACPP